MTHAVTGFFFYMGHLIERGIYLKILNINLTWASIIYMYKAFNREWMSIRSFMVCYIHRLLCLTTIIIEPRMLFFKWQNCKGQIKRIQHAGPTLSNITGLLNTTCWICFSTLLMLDEFD